MELSGKDGAAMPAMTVTIRRFTEEASDHSAPPRLIEGAIV
jgi:hypothetical protein